jgi:hypothetical protein
LNSIGGGCGTRPIDRERKCPGVPRGWNRERQGTAQTLVDQRTAVIFGTLILNYIEISMTYMFAVLFRVARHDFNDLDRYAMGHCLVAEATRLNFVACPASSNGALMSKRVKERCR